MTVRDRVYSAFKESFDLDDDTNTSKLVYQELPGLDVDRSHDSGRRPRIGIRYDAGDGRHSGNEQLRQDGVDHEQIRPMTLEAATPQEAGSRPPSIGLVSVIVPHLDDYDNLDACLTLLAGQSFPSDRTEIIVADNGSSRGLDAVRRIVGTRGQVARRRGARRRTGPQRRGSRIARRRARVHRQRLPAGPALARRGPRRAAVGGFRRRANRRPGRGSAADDGGGSVRERLRVPERALRQEPQLHRHRLDVRVALGVRRGRGV